MSSMRVQAPKHEMSTQNSALSSSTETLHTPYLGTLDPWGSSRHVLVGSQHF